MICKNCKSENINGSNYCTSCGEPLKKGNNKYSQKRKNKKQDSTQFPILSYLMSHKLLWLYTSIILTFIIVIVAANSNNNRTGYNPQLEIPSSNPQIEAAVFEVASNFVCGCGSCGEESLEKCECEYAIKERQIIRNHLEQGQSKSEIITIINNSYGGLKSTSINKSSIDSKIIPLPMENNTTAKKIAQLTDKNVIYSAFECPCGQCGMDELIDCNCNHKNGATEVKKFINSQILTKQFTVDEIIENVNKKFGGKKS